MLHADLVKDGMPGRGEQLWAKQIATGLFQICCIPFFTYGIALGDTVEADSENIIRKVRERSGHKNLRVAITSEEAIVHNDLHAWAEKTGLLYEWFEAKYLAIDLPPAVEENLDLTYFQRLTQENKAVFEIEPRPV